MRLELPFPPSSNRYWRNFRGQTVKSTEASEYQTRIKWIAKSKLGMDWRPLEGEVSLSIALYRPRRSGDLSNRIKILEDSLQGILYVNDSQVTELHAYRFEDKANPRAVVVVAAMPK